MGRRRWRKLGRVVFHAGALVSLVLGTLAGALWMRGHLLTDELSWVAQEKRDGLRVRQGWTVEAGAGFLGLGAWREVSHSPDIVGPPESPRSSRFLGKDDGPPYPPLLPTAASRFHYSFNGPYVPRFLPRTSYAGRYRFPALLSKRTRYFFLLDHGALATGEWSTPYFAGREWGLIVPLRAVVAVLAVWPACWEFLYRRGLYRKALARWRRERRLCVACGYDLRASTSGRCPECGLEGAVEGAAGA